MDKTPVLVATMGAPGSGKTTWARAQGLTLVGRDHVRRHLGLPPVGTPEQEAHVSQAQEDWIRAAWTQGGTPCMDDTLSHPGEGQRIRSIAGTAYTVLVDLRCAPLGLCLARNAGRPAGERVPEEVVREIHAGLTARDQWGTPLVPIGWQDWRITWQQVSSLLPLGTVVIWRHRRTGRRYWGRVLSASQEESNIDVATGGRVVGGELRPDPAGTMHLGLPLAALSVVDPDDVGSTTYRWGRDIVTPVRPWSVWPRWYTPPALVS